MKKSDDSSAPPPPPPPFLSRSITHLGYPDTPQRAAARARQRAVIAAHAKGEMSVDVAQKLANQAARTKHGSISAIGIFNEGARKWQDARRNPTFRPPESCKGDEIDRGYRDDRDPDAPALLAAACAA